ISLVYVDSTDGSLFSSQPVKKLFLQGNDIIEIGKYKLKYVNETPAITTKADFEKTMVLRSPAASAPKPDAKALTDTQTNLEVPTKSSDMTASTPSTATAPADATLPGIAGTKPDPVTVAVAQSASTSSVTTQGGGTIQIL